jgi:hypothetical protein
MLDVCQTGDAIMCVVTDQAGPRGRREAAAEDARTPHQGITQRVPGYECLSGR